MRSLLIYESSFGNTRTIAKAVAEGLSAHLEVEVTEAHEARPLLDDRLDLLVLGGPTQGFSLSRPGTRSGASK